MIELRMDVQSLVAVLKRAASHNPDEIKAAEHMLNQVVTEFN